MQNTVKTALSLIRELSRFVLELQLSEIIGILSKIVKTYSL